MRHPHKMFKHTQTICQLFPTNCLSMFDHFVWFAFKGLMPIVNESFLFEELINFYFFFGVLVSIQMKFGQMVL